MASATVAQSTCRRPCSFRRAFGRAGVVAGSAVAVVGVALTVGDKEGAAGDIPVTGVALDTVLTFRAQM
jgi:hypothetical protein